MSVVPPEFKIAKRSVQGQITNHLREEIRNGNLKSGIKLPSNLELAARWKTPQNTIQRSMQLLVKEGLLTRIPGVGTFIREREEKLTCVGVYSGTSHMNSAYTQAVREALKEELHTAGIEMDLWMDSRPLNQQGELWQPLAKAAEQRQFQAFIGVETDMPLMQWQRKLPVPVAFQGGPASMQNSVNQELGQFVEISLQELARQGCRSVGFISPIVDEPETNNLEWFQSVSFGMLKRFMAIAGDLGLALKNDWMRLLRDQPHGASGQERFGYEQFLKLWSQPEKPEGLLVFTDFTARGVILAIHEKQVSVPQDLKLALHKNESIDLVCPMPATFVVSSEREMARALIEQVQKQFRGETCERISLPFKLVAHGGS